jgi:hypothetical protein
MTRNSVPNRTTSPVDSHHPIAGDPAPLLTVPDVQARLRCSRAQAYSLVQTSIPVVRLGRSIRVRPETLDGWLREQEQTAGTSA